MVDDRGRRVGSVQREAVGGRVCVVNAILVLSGLPRLLTGSIMAHECMHAFLRLSGFEEAAAPPAGAARSQQHTGLAPEVEEGLCQLVALLWLEQAGSALLVAAPAAVGAAAAYERRLAAYFAHAIREEQSRVYGDGFRAAFDCFQRLGGRLDAVLARVRQTGGF